MDEMKKETSKTKTGEPAPPLRRLALVLVMGYIAAVVLSYFLAGEQLHLRQSRGNFELPAADSGTVELAAGAVVEQFFTTEIQRLEQVDIQWGTYYRPNVGTVLAELVDLAEEKKRLEKELAARKNELAGLESRLNNPSFVSKAPAQVVESEKERAVQLTALVAKLDAQLKEM